MPSLHGQIVIDLGCGVGDLAAELVARGARVIGCETAAFTVSRTLTVQDQELSFSGPPLPRCLTLGGRGSTALWVRERWVGLSLPLAQRKASPLSFLTSGVLSGPKGFMAWIGALLTGKFKLRPGFLVETQAAIAVLAQSSPEAAEWWRTKTPHLLTGKRYFVFPEAVGHVVGP